MSPELRAVIAVMFALSGLSLLIAIRESSFFATEAALRCEAR